MKNEFQPPSEEERRAFVLDAWKDQNCAPPADVRPRDALDFGHTAIAAYAMRLIWEARHEPIPPDFCDLDGQEQ